MPVIVMDMVSLISETYIFIMLARLALVRRSKSKIYSIFLFVFVCTFQIGFGSILERPFIRCFAFILLDYIYVNLRFKDKWPIKVGWLLIIYAVVYCIDSVVMGVVLLHHPGTGMTDYLTDSGEIFLLTITLRLVELMMIKLFEYFKKILPDLYKNAYLFIIAMLMLVFGFAFPYYWSLNDSHLRQTLILSGLISLVFVVFVVSTKIEIQRIAKNSNQLDRKWRTENEKNKQLQERNRLLRKAVHNAHHDNIYILSALEQGETARAMEYIYSRDAVIEKTSYDPIVGNPDIDALIRHMETGAQKQGVQIHAHGMIPYSLPFDSYDLNNLIANALENAVEAAAKLSEPDLKTVDLYMGFRENCLSIVVKNLGKEPLRLPDGAFFSERDAGRGIGMEIMYEIADKYEGAIVPQYEGRVFTLSVILQNIAD